MTKLIPAIEQFLDDVEALRLENLIEIVDTNWEEMQTLPSPARRTA